MIRESGIRILFGNEKSMDMEEFLIYMLVGQAEEEWKKETLKAHAVIARTKDRKSVV